jgi:hypothetical protein
MISASGGDSHHVDVADKDDLGHIYFKATKEDPSLWSLKQLEIDKLFRVVEVSGIQCPHPECLCSSQTTGVGPHSCDAM